MKIPPRSILYFGSDSTASTSRHRADALRRLGCQVAVVDPEELIGPRRKWQVFLDYRTGYRWLQRRLLQSLRSNPVCGGICPDLIWIDSGELCGPTVLDWLASRFSCPIILYNVDDPTGQRDCLRFKSLIASLPYYCLCVFVRPETALESLALGARRVLTVHRSWDENFHVPLSGAAGLSIEPVVSFIGTSIPGERRDRFLLDLLMAGLPLQLIGNRWKRSPFWASLQHAYKGPALGGSAYAEALGSAAVSLGFLSHGNRDLITTRSLEAPACGALLCAERTSEHQLLYEDGQAAVFWSSTAECIEKCRQLLDQPQRSASIRAAGFQQLQRLGVGNEDICRQILAAL